MVWDGPLGLARGYAIPTFAKEALRAIEVAGLAASGTPPVIVAHSFGGFPTLYICAEHPEVISGAMLVDSAPPRKGGGPPPRLAQGRTGAQPLPDAGRGLRRFRFLPEQDTGRPEIIDHMARGSLQEVPGRPTSRPAGPGASTRSSGASSTAATWPKG